MVRHYLRTCEVTEVEKDMVKNVVRQAKRGFIINHQQRTGFWPKHLIDSDAGRGLKLAPLLGKHPESKLIRQEIENIPLNQYDYVKFLPCKDLKAPDNLFGYLKDRTISLSRSNVLKNYLNLQFGSITNEKDYYDQMHRLSRNRLYERLIIRYLIIIIIIIIIIGLLIISTKINLIFSNI